jgi:hypothetical protein
MLRERRERILRKLAQAAPPPAGMMSAGAPQLVPPPANLGVSNPPQQVPFGGARPPTQSPQNMLSPNTLKTPAVKALMHR